LLVEFSDGFAEFLIIDPISGEDLPFVLQVKVLKEVLDLEISHLVLELIPQPHLIASCLAPSDAVRQKLDILNSTGLMPDLNRKGIRHLDGYFDIGEYGLSLMVDMKFLLVDLLAVLEYSYTESVRNIV
jgi:hypothetical protein